MIYRTGPDFQSFVTEFMQFQKTGFNSQKPVNTGFGSQERKIEKRDIGSVINLKREMQIYKEAEEFSFDKFR
jgi:hypothetical protein